MGSLILAAPAAVLGEIAWTSIRTGCDWMRYRQWDAAATNIAIGAVFGGLATMLAIKALPARH